MVNVGKHQQDSSKAAQGVLRDQRGGQGAEPPARGERTAADAEDPGAQSDRRHQARKREAIAVEQLFARHPRDQADQECGEEHDEISRGSADRTSLSSRCAAAVRAIQCCKGKVIAAAEKLQYVQSTDTGAAVSGPNARVVTAKKT